MEDIPLGFILILFGFFVAAIVHRYRVEAAQVAAA